MEKSISAKESVLPNVTELPCFKPCTKTIKFMTEKQVDPNIGISLPPYTEVDGYSHINIFVRFTQETANEPPVDLGVIFAFDKKGKMGARRYVNLEHNVQAPQATNFIEVNGSGTWHGQQWKISTYLARLPIMGPYVQVFVYNRATVARKVSVWAYLVA
jgi:hypothetical protein